jgi:hypothetical protein
MKQIEKFKTIVNNISDSSELAGFLDGFRIAASLFCKENCPDEAILENGRIKDITIYGMIEFLESEIE